MPTPTFKCLLLVFLVVCLVGPFAGAQEADVSEVDSAIAGLSARPVGPALMGGRISDIAVHPEIPSTWYVAVGSGGLWKTRNAGISWDPVFEHQPSYSIGSVAVDPSDPEVIWVGTGENVSGRHVGFGDGVYNSRNGGRTWQRMGLEKSEHIGKIVVDPRASNVVYVAAEGPLWTSGGERGLYKTVDGGATWEKILEIDDDTGVTDLELDPRNPDVVYAASYQRRRKVWSLLAGGPGSGIHKSTDGGQTWRRIASGLPTGELGKIGLDVSGANPDVVYATIEADEKGRGMYRSTDRGESWEKRSSYISNGTGPHYYQEIEASPYDVDTVYQMDVFIHVTRDGGASFDILGDGRQKHSDNHALWIDPSQQNHLLAGTDAGLYESFDDGTTWRHFPNMPISQFYKLALDSSEPFYNIMGGAQDLGTLIGPSRTMTTDGVRNEDWYVPMGADGYDCEFDPSDPNTAYLEWQGGSLLRLDRRTNEILDIKPQPGPGDPPERWNWDAPILISPHASSRLYFGSYRVWRSDNRGDSWTPVSGDLTSGKNRYELPVMGRVQSVDALYDNGAMSLYATLTGISESPRREGLIYTGSDDGQIHVTEDGGRNWRRAATPPGVPDLSFVNDIEASQSDPDTVFVAMDAHKSGDFSPMLFKSTDRGRSWMSISGDLPENSLVWAIEQDHVNADLLFIGAEFGMHVSLNGGTNWVKISGTPTISFRDIALQRRDSDLVGASFGRGFYVLDDYSALRDMAGVAGGAGNLFPVRDAWWYVPSEPMQARGRPTLGTDAFATPNPPFGAVFTYHLGEVPKTSREARTENEKELDGDVPFPGWDRLRSEALEQGPMVLLTVSDANGNPVRRLRAPAKKGTHRVNWDLRLQAPNPVNLVVPDFQPPWGGSPSGPLAAPGRYRVELALVTQDGVRSLGTARQFEVKTLPDDPAGYDFDAVAAFQKQTGDIMREVAGGAAELGRASNRMRHMREALLDTAGADPALFGRWNDINTRIAGLRTRVQFDRIRGGLNEPSVPSIMGRIQQVSGGHWQTRQTPTQTQRTNLEIAQRDWTSAKAALKTLLETDLPNLEAALEAAGAPWTPGRRIP